MFVQVKLKLSKAKGKGRIVAYHALGADGCGNHRTYNGKSAFNERGEFIDSSKIVYGGLSLLRLCLILENGEEIELYKVKNSASADNERPVVLVIGTEEQHLQRIMKLLNDMSKEAMNTDFIIDCDGQEVKINAHIDLFKMDGKTHKYVQGRGGAWCLLCSTPRSQMHNRDLVLDGFPLDIGIQSLWEHYNSLADHTIDGEQFIDTTKIPTEARAGITGPPLVEDMEIAHFLPSLHCYLRFLAFFIELAIRFKSGNFMHGHVSETIKKKMTLAKKWFQEDALKHLQKRYAMPSRGGGSTDTGGAAR